MKNILSALLALFLLMSFSYAQDPVSDAIKNTVQQASNNSRIVMSGTLTNIQVNPNAGKKDGSKIVLVYLTWNMKNKAPQTIQMLQMQSARLVNEIGKHSEVSEIVVFWEVPYHKQGSNIAKFNYAKKDNDWMGTAEWFDPVLR